MNHQKNLFTLLLLCMCNLGLAEEGPEPTDPTSTESNPTQILTPIDEEQEPKPTQVLTPIYDEGYWLIAPHKKIRLGGLVEIDGRFFTQSDGNNSTFLVRRARLFLTGNILEHFNYMIQGKWDFQKAGLQSAWIETLNPSYMQVRVGLFTKPFSLEETYSDTFWDFNERSIGGINFIRSRDIGVMAYGVFAHDCIEYGIGVINGNGPNLDNNNNKDVVGRLSIYPFYTTNNSLKNLGLSVSGEIGRYYENLTNTNFITGAGTAFWTWTNATVNARRIQWGADIEWFYRSVAIRGEYYYANWRRVKEDGISKPFAVHSGYVESSYFLTGEEQPGDAKIIPKRNLDFKGGWGAWQLAARYEMCHLSEQPLQAGMAKGANFTKGPTVAINWFFNPYIAMKMDWQYLHFNHKLPNSSEKNFESVIIARMQALF